MKVIEIDRPAAWLPIRDKGLNVRSYDSYRYMTKGGIIVDASHAKPVQRYAKNYGDGSFSLIMISTEKDTKKIEKFMDEASALFKSKASPKFEYLKTKYGETK